MKPVNKCVKCFVSETKKHYDQLGELIKLYSPDGLTHNNPDCFMISMKRHISTMRRAINHSTKKTYYATFTIDPKQYPSLPLRVSYIRRLAFRLTRSLKLTPENSTMCIEGLDNNPHIHLLWQVPPRSYISISTLRRLNKKMRTELKSLRTSLDIKKVLYYIHKTQLHKEMFAPTLLYDQYINGVEDFSTT